MRFLHWLIYHTWPHDGLMCWSLTHFLSSAKSVLWCYCNVHYTIDHTIYHHFLLLLKVFHIVIVMYTIYLPGWLLNIQFSETRKRVPSFFVLYYVLIYISLGHDALSVKNNSDLQAIRNIILQWLNHKVLVCAYLASLHVFILIFMASNQVFLIRVYLVLIFCVYSMPDLFRSLFDDPFLDLCAFMDDFLYFMLYNWWMSVLSYSFLFLVHIIHKFCFMVFAAHMVIRLCVLRVGYMQGVSWPPYDYVDEHA